MSAEIKTGSHPYSDGSGYEYDIEISSRTDGAPAIWLNNSFIIDLDDWEQLKADIDTAIAAFNALPQ